LFERESLRRHPAPRREARAGNPDVSHALLASTSKKLDPTAESYVILKGETVASTLSHRYDSSPCTDRGQDVVAFTCKDYTQDARLNCSPTMRSMNNNNSTPNGGGQLAIAFAQNQRDELRELTAAGALAAEPGMKQQSYVITGTDKTNRVAFETEVCGSLRTKPPCHQENSSTTVAAQNHMVRRLTPTECERLQGFPDGYTDIVYRGKRACDGPRYKALGNSMAVNVMRWLGLRIHDVETMLDRSR
jgi:DNA (cytosine-5)-methyltransferase 1